MGVDADKKAMILSCIPINPFEPYKVALNSDSLSLCAQYIQVAFLT